MSLLMDALRRAEAEKKHAAAQRDDLSIDLPETSGDLSLEPLEPSTERPLRVLGADDTTYAAQAPTFRQPILREDVGRGTTDDEAFAFQTAPGPGNAVQPTLVTAQTVFEATRGGGVPRALITLIVATVLLAAGLTAVGIYAYHQTPPTHEIPSPRIAAQIERQPSPRATDAPAPLPLPAPAPHAVAPAAPAPGAEPAAPAAGTNVAQADDPRPLASDTPDAAPVSPPPALVAPALPPPAIAAPPSTRALATVIPRDAEITSGEVRIAKSAESMQPDDVTRAYGAFQLGKLDVATTLYRRTLARDPARVDALLGLGAIAMRERRLADAHHYYREVLARSPRHPVASAALFMLDGGDSNEASEARLKLLADREADSPYLRFALGNLYAKQQRWSDAQEAYFAAFARAPANADYAYNLAVSLDQLGQRKAALGYYRKALALRAPGAAFDAARAHARVAALLGAP